MHEEYEREFKLVERSEEEFDIELIKSIIKTKQEIENANRNFEFAEDDLVDYYLYEIKANQAKLNYLIGKAKKHGLVIDRIKEIGIRNMNSQVI